jgi:molybdate transport system substrate-binding protein
MTLCSVIEQIQENFSVHKRNLLRLAVTAAASAFGMSHRPAATTTQPIRVAAASDLQFAMAELAQQYRSETGQAVQLSLGSSGNFAQQIRQGLPADLFLSADEEFVFQLAQAGLTQGRGVVYALGRIAILVPASSTVALDPALRGLREALLRLRHFAIANPEHAPYGRAAQQALERLGLWPLVLPKLVIGENIAQATQFVSQGAAQAGMTAASLALAPEVARSTRSLVLPAELHAPLRQRMVLLRSAGAPAADFYRFLQTPAARTVLQRYGFGVA